MFFVPLLVRMHGLSTGEAGTAFAIVLGIASTIGVAMGGVSVDRLGRRDLRWYLWLPAAALSVATPLYAIGLLQRSEEHTSELQSLMRISYAVFCLKKKKHDRHRYAYHTSHN